MISVEEDKNSKKDEYFVAAQGWQEEIYDSVSQKARTGWLVAFMSLGTNLLLGFALMFLVPLKSVIPYVIKYNSVTGETHVAKPLKEGKLTQSEALTKYWVVKYVRARTGYDRQDLELSYEMVKMMSDVDEFSRYAKWFDPKREDSPFQQYGSDTIVETKVKSIAFLDKDTASVRIDIHEKGNGRPSITPWLVTLTFQFTLEPRSEAERFENPLGFQVVTWRLDAEVEVDVGE